MAATVMERLAAAADHNERVSHQVAALAQQFALLALRGSETNVRALGEPSTTETATTLREDVRSLAAQLGSLSAAMATRAEPAAATRAELSDLKDLLTGLEDLPDLTNTVDSIRRRLDELVTRLVGG
jgi:hypothetical protein